MSATWPLCAAWCSRVPRGQEERHPASQGTQRYLSHTLLGSANQRFKRVEKQTPRPEGKSDKSPLRRPVDPERWDFGAGYYYTADPKELMN